jgi:hypothetical protein
MTTRARPRGIGHRCRRWPSRIGDLRPHRVLARLIVSTPTLASARSCKGNTGQSEQRLDERSTVLSTTIARRCCPSLFLRPSAARSGGSWRRSRLGKARVAAAYKLPRWRDTLSGRVVAPVLVPKAQADRRAAGQREQRYRGIVERTGGSTRGKPTAPWTRRRCASRTRTARRSGAPTDR